MENSDFKMEDFMDVVYKCKFCPYSCTQSPEMGLHVKEKHLKQQSYSHSEKNTVSGMSLPPGNFLYNVGNSTLLTIPESSILTNGDKNVNFQVREADDVLSFTQPEGQAYMDKSLPRELMSVVKDKGPVLENQVHPMSLESVVPLPGPAPLSAFSSSPSTILPPNVNHASSQSMAVMAIQLPTMNTESNSSQYIVQTGDNQLSLAAAETKEFLLCGLCKLAFTSMEDCQSHMQTEHRELMQGVGVSIGVQVGGGKRGRKRKTESQPVVKIKEEPDLDPDDLEWLPSVPEGTQTTHRDGRLGRKVNPPKALKEDYVLGRRVVKKRQRHDNNSLGYNMICPMMSCKARFKSKESLEIHLSSHNLDDASFTCPECQASHDFWKHLRIHLWKVHKIDVDLLTCEHCDYKTDTSHKMSIHKEIHREEKPYKCNICNKGFRQAAQQKNHMTIHKTSNVQEESSLWFSSKKCDTCERVFANSKCLAKHKEAVHAKLKPFQCSFCNHTTARKAMMELHVRTHTGEKPFKCDVCSYTTGDHNSMRRHKMRHTGEKQYHCGICPYTCIQSISLKQHIKNKHPGANTGIFQCSRCPFRSINQTLFDSHLLDHKKGLIPDIPVTLKVNEAKTKKLTQKQSSGNTKQRGLSVQNEVESLFRKHPQFHTIMPGESTPQSTLDSISVGTSVGNVQSEVFNMQVTMLAGGDTQVSAEDMNRLSENPNLMALGISPLQLIYATLSTISEQADMSCVEEGRSSLLTIELVGGIQTSVLSSVQDNSISHSITYHFPVITSTTATTTVAVPAPASGDKDDIEGEVIAKIQSVINVESTDILDKVQTSSSSSLSVSSLPPSTSSIVVSNLLVEKEESNVQKVGVDGDVQISNLVSSSFMGPSLNSSFISLVGASEKTNQEIPESQEVEEEQRSVFLIEDSDLVEKNSVGQSVDEGQPNAGGSSLIVLGGKGMELSGIVREECLSNQSKIDNMPGTTPDGLTSLMSTDQNLTMINANASDIMHFIPISFLDQNGQGLSTAQTFIPSSSC